MKTSIKILILIALLLLGTLITSLFLLKKDIQRLVDEQSLLEYREVNAEKFSRVIISSNWQVEIMQGKQCKVELASHKADSSLPQISYHDGLLKLQVSERDSLPNNLELYARLTMPGIKGIQAQGNSQIEIRNYWTDTLKITLLDSATYKGTDNDIGHVIFSASGGVD